MTVVTPFESFVMIESPVTSPYPLAIGQFSEGEGGPCNGRRPLKMSDRNIT